MKRRIAEAVAQARAEGRVPAHLALTKDDERELGIGCVLYAGLPVKRAWSGKKSNLWAAANNTLRAYPL